MKLGVNSDFCRQPGVQLESRDRKSTRLNSSHPSISYAVFCLKKKKKQKKLQPDTYVTVETPRAPTALTHDPPLHSPILAYYLPHHHLHLAASVRMTDVSATEQ